MTDPHVHVNDAQVREFAPDLPARIEAGVLSALETGRADGCSVGDAEVSVTLVEADEMCDLNRRFHDVDEPTDVLAFELGSGDGGPDLLGDLYLCPRVAVESAEQHGQSPETELVRLAIHGTLHLLGHDHPDGEDRYESQMFRLQEQLLKGLD